MLAWEIRFLEACGKLDADLGYHVLVPDAYGPHKTLNNRWKRWGERGVFARMMEGLATARPSRRS